MGKRKSTSKPQGKNHMFTELNNYKQLDNLIQTKY